MNKEFTFQFRDEYSQHLMKMGFDTGNLLFLSGVKYNEFVSDVFFEKEVSPYWGTFLNDSLKIKKSINLSESIACMGRIISDVSQQVTNIRGNDIETVSKKINYYNFFQFGSRKKWDINMSKRKLKILLIYSYSFGSYYGATYKELLLFQKQHKEDVDLFIILIDKVDNLK